MKKLILILLLGGFALTSCQKEDLSSVAELDAVEGRGQSKKDVKNNGNNGNGGECYIDLTPDLTSPATLCVDNKLGTLGDNTYFDSYFDLRLKDTDLAGNYAAWCIDQGATLANLACDFEADVYSSYETISGIGDIVTTPANFDKVNYLLNQDLSSYTAGAIQAAIWEILGEGAPVNPGPLGDLTTVPALVTLANSMPAGWMPGQGDKLYLILIPRNGDQAVIIPRVLECAPCETAFAKGTNVDSDSFCQGVDNTSFSRWGWTTQVNTSGSYNFDVWAGAGQCNTNKGTLVGTANVSFSGGVIDVNYSIEPGYVIEEEHVYAGSTPFPENNGEYTVAPGQYYEEPGLDGDVWVILHTVVCEGSED